MVTETAVLGDTHRCVAPSIFVSHGSRGDYSASISEFVVERDYKPSVSDMGPASTESDISFESIWTKPDPADRSQKAMYDFSTVVSRIAQVRAVTQQEDGDVIIVWTYIQKRDKEVRSAIYSVELDVMDRYPDIFFDFNVISLDSFSTPRVPQNIRGTLTFYRSRNDD